MTVDSMTCLFRVYTTFSASFLMSITLIMQSHFLSQTLLPSWFCVPGPAYFCVHPLVWQATFCATTISWPTWSKCLNCAACLAAQFPILTEEESVGLAEVVPLLWCPTVWPWQIAAVDPTNATRPQTTFSNVAILFLFNRQPHFYVINFANFICNVFTLNLWNL